MATITPAVLPEAASAYAPRLPGPVLGIDLGSAWVGLVIAPDVLPLRPVGVTMRVDPHDLGPSVKAIVDLAIASNVAHVVVEKAPRLYAKPPKPGATHAEVLRVIRANAAMGEAYAICGRVLEALKIGFVAAGIHGETISRPTWAHRVVPHTMGGITDAQAIAGLRGHVAPECWRELHTQHEIDACGAIAGLLIPAPAKAVRRRDRGRVRPLVLLTKEQRKAASRQRKRVKERTARGADVAARLAGTCTCGPDGGPRPVTRTGRHKVTCAVAPAAKARKVSFYVMYDRPAPKKPRVDVLAAHAHAERHPSRPADMSAWREHFADAGEELEPEPKGEPTR